jgi:hypothetical protein
MGKRRQLNQPDHFAKELRREKMIANISSTERKSSISVTFLSCGQCDFAVFNYLYPTQEKNKNEEG